MMKTRHLRNLLLATLRIAALTALFALVGGCAQRVWNTRISAEDSAGRYEFRTRLPENSDELFVVLAFSGGGTRAASFSYGVLQALRDTNITVAGKKRTLLDEVDVITSVSGGSYTAAYYGLFGDRIFSDFTRDFLYRDWQSDLIGLLYRPANLAALASPQYNRSDVVASHLNRTLFAGSTFADMSTGNRPFVILNASDLNNATTFSFIQQQFDFLCSDLSSYRVANAVMASSALPGPFAPIALRNFPDCPERHRAWVAEALANDSFLDRRRGVALALERYSDFERMPIVRLVDGGVTDNLGVRGSMMSPVAQYGNVPDMAGAFTPEQLKHVRHVLVVVANAEIYPETAWSLSGREPGLYATLKSSFDAALGILNTETVGLAKQGFQMWEQRVNDTRGADEPRVTVDFSVMTFGQIEDQVTRDRFNAMPTTFALSQQEVDSLIEQSGILLRNSPEFVRFLHQIDPNSGGRPK